MTKSATPNLTTYHATNYDTPSDIKSSAFLAFDPAVPHVIELLALRGIPECYDGHVTI